MQMTALAARESAEARGPETGALVDDKRAAVPVKNFQQAVDEHEGQLVDRQKIRRARRVQRPAVDVHVEHRRQRRRGATFFDFNSHAPVEVGELLLDSLDRSTHEFRSAKNLAAA